MVGIYLFIPEVVDSVLVGVIIHYMDLLMECWVHIPKNSPFRKNNVDPHLFHL